AELAALAHCNRPRHREAARLDRARHRALAPRLRRAQQIAPARARGQREHLHVQRGLGAAAVEPVEAFAARRLAGQTPRTLEHALGPPTQRFEPRSPLAVHPPADHEVRLADMPLETLNEAERYLDGLINREKKTQYDYERLGLGPIRALLAEIGHPERGLPCILVAGSKGKGT